MSLGVYCNSGGYRVSQISGEVKVGKPGHMQEIRTPSYFTPGNLLTLTHDSSVFLLPDRELSESQVLISIVYLELACRAAFAAPGITAEISTDLVNVGGFSIFPYEMIEQLVKIFGELEEERRAKS